MGGWAEGGRDLVVSIVGNMTSSCYKWIFSSFSNPYYNSPISTVRIQLHVSALYVGHLQVEIFLTYRSVIQDVWGVWVGGQGGTRSRCFNSG